MSKPSKEELKSLADKAHERLTDHQHAITKLYEDQQKSLVATSDCWFDGQLQISSLIFYSPVEIKDMEFNCSGTVLEFNGQMWGPGLGRVNVYGGGYTHKDPDWFIGREVDFELIFAAGGVGAVQMSFWYEGAIVGAFDAVGAGVGAAAGWGSGTFKKV